MPKDPRFLSRRRKNQLIRSRIQFYTINSNSSVENTRALTNEMSAHNVEKNIVVTSTQIKNLTCYFPLDVSSKLQVDSVETINSIDNKYIKNDLNFNTWLNTFEADNDTCETSNNSFNLRDKLFSWALAENITQKSINSLLQILRDCGHTTLPRDARTLMQTPKNATREIKKISGGSYIHFGIANGLLRLITKYFKECPNTIDILINVDGISISKSSTSQFWPILVSIFDIRKKPFAAGVFHGMSKPNDANQYLSPLVNELIVLEEHGFNYNGKMCKVLVKGIVCDAPARAFITYTKNHSGYFGCSKCVQEGEYINSVIFPEYNCTLRTDESFRKKQQEEHHIGVSILEMLKINMISQVAIDYMHLVCLGVMKRLLQFWTKGFKGVRFSKDHQNYLSEMLLLLRPFIPYEFSRLPRSLHEVDKWKATELRLFLLYIGPVILKSVMSAKYYEHFLTLSVAIRILCHPELCFTLNDYAHNLLIYFVHYYENLYGRQYMSYNIHNLTHLANEVKTFGCLDKFSCFPFENYLRILRLKIKNSPYPLEQLVNRINEENVCINVKEFDKSYPIIHYCKLKSKIILVEFQEFTMSYKKPNNVCLLKNNTILIIKKIFMSDKILNFCGDKFITTEPLFLKPCNSKNLNISVISNSVIVNDVIIPASQVRGKCLKVTYSDREIIIPLIHLSN